MKRLLLLLVLPFLAAAQESTIVLKIGTALDGRGHVLRNTNIVVQGAQIAKLDPARQPFDYDLSRWTVLPSRFGMSLAGWPTWAAEL